MTGGPGLPPLLRRLIGAMLPRHRRDDVLGDMDEVHGRRTERLGRRAANRLIVRECVALILWRVGGRSPADRQPGSGGERQDRAYRGRGNMAGDVWQDLKFGVRALARRPGFSLVAVVVIGLGIGAPTTVLTLVNRIFFEKPSEVLEPHRLVRVWRSWAPGQGGGSLMNPDYTYYREGVRTLSGLAAWGGAQVASYTLDGTRSDQLTTLAVSDNYFDVLGVTPRRGRFFAPEENQVAGEVPVAVVSEGFWRRALGADGDVVGRTLSMNGITFTVVGVAPAGFRGLSPLEDAPDAWVPIAMFGALGRSSDSAWWERLPNQRSSWLSMVGRLAPGVTFEAAEADLTRLSDGLVYPGRGEDEGLLVSRQALYSPSQASTLSTLSRLLLGVVLIVLVIATANLAVLLLSRATTRAREMGIRTAVGAARSRLFRQLLTESLLLGAVGGAVGVALAWALSDAAASLLPYAFVDDFRPDLRVLAAAVVLALATAGIAGLLPALHAARTEVAVMLRGGAGHHGRSRARDVLVVAQLALSLVLLAGAGLFARSFWSARTQELGFSTEDRLVLQVDLRTLDYGPDEGIAFISDARARLATLPGVRGVATTRMVPFRGDWSTDLDPPPGALPNAEDGTLWVGLNAVSPDYFGAMEMDLVRGRPLGAADGPSDAPAVVLNETLAAHLFPDVDPLGRSIEIGGERSLTVVGIVRDAVYYELGEPPTTQAYLAVAQSYQPLVHFVIHSRGPATDLVASAQAALRELDPDLVIGSVTTLAAVFDDVTARYEVSAVLVGLFGGLALLLASAGLYGVVSFLVAQRTREIGVRMALGAGRGQVARHVLGTSLRLAGVGLGIGLVGALAVRGFVGSLLFGAVRPDDPWALVGGCLILTVVVVLASLAPARRAMRVDPMDAIRSD